MKNFIALTISLMLASTPFAQDSLSITFTPTPISENKFDQSTSYPYRHLYDGKARWRATPMLTVGVAAGSETFFGVKASFLGRYAYSRRMKRSNRELTLFGVHGGVEVSGFGLFAAWGSAGVNAGISAGPVTLDGSLTFWGAVGENNSIGTTTYNPKIGLKILDAVWIKTGFTYFLRGNNITPNWMKIGENYMNFEVCFVETF